MERYLAVVHDEGIRYSFVIIVCCLGAPENVRVVAVNAPQLHGKRRSRFCKLRKDHFKECANGSRSFEWSERREHDRGRRVVGDDAVKVAPAKAIEMAIK